MTTDTENIQETIGSEEQIRGKIIICVDSNEIIKDLERLNLSFDSSEEDILNAIRPIVQERYNVDIKDNNSWLYKTRKIVESQNIYILPNSTAGL